MLWARFWLIWPVPNCYQILDIFESYLWTWITDALKITVQLICWQTGSLNFLRVWRSEGLHVWNFWDSEILSSLDFLKVWGSEDLLAWNFWYSDVLVFWVSDNLLVWNFWYYETLVIWVVWIFWRSEGLRVLLVWNFWYSKTLVFWVVWTFWVSECLTICLSEISDIPKLWFSE